MHIKIYRCKYIYICIHVCVYVHCTQLHWQRTPKAPQLHQDRLVQDEYHVPSRAPPITEQPCTLKCSIDVDSPLTFMNLSEIDLFIKNNPCTSMPPCGKENTVCIYIYRDTYIYMYIYTCIYIYIHDCSNWKIPVDHGIPQTRMMFIYLYSIKKRITQFAFGL